MPFSLLSLLPSGITALGSVASSLINSGQNQQLWDKQQAYNTPAAQRQRLEDAGFNPYFAMSNGAINAGSASTAPPPSTLSESVNSGLQTAASLANTFLNQRLIDAEVNNNDADTDLKAAQSAKTIAETNQIHDYLNPKLEAETNKIKQDEKLAWEQTDLLKMQADTYAMFGQKTAESLLEKMEYEKQQIAANTRLTDEQKLLIIAQRVETYARAHNINVNTDQLVKMFPLLLTGKTLENKGQDIRNYWTP